MSIRRTFVLAAGLALTATACGDAEVQVKPGQDADNKSAVVRFDDEGNFVIPAEFMKAAQSENCCAPCKCDTKPAKSSAPGW